MAKVACNCASCVRNRSYHKAYHDAHKEQVAQWHKNHQERSKLERKLGRLLLAGKTPNDAQVESLRKQIALLKTKGS